MWKNVVVVDVHAHMSTPPEFGAVVNTMVALNTPNQRFSLTDESLEGALQRHLRVMDERSIDFQLVGPRPVGMYHWMRPFLQAAWSRITNNVIAQTVKLHPNRFAGMAQLPQNPFDNDTKRCADELTRCVEELGFVGGYINPDPGGAKTVPGLNDEYWYPLYETAQKLDVPLLVHPSTSADRRIEVVPNNYQINNVTEEYIATMILEHSSVFTDFPQLRVCISHCGGALQRFTLEDEQHIGKVGEANLTFDSCAYQSDFLTAAIKQKGVRRILFGTEAPGAGSAIRKDTNRPSDDVIPTLEGLGILSDEDMTGILHDNPLRVFTKVNLLPDTKSEPPPTGEGFVNFWDRAGR